MNQSATGRTWVRLDNVSNIFLAARTDADPKVFRLAAELTEPVDPERLQRALDATYDHYPLYHAVLRSGVFWYYLQASDLRPVVTAEDHHTCAPLYQTDKRNLLFRVSHHRRRINLEVFHALSDGAGAMRFLTDLVSAYAADSAPAVEPEVEPQRGLSIDSFTHYFRRRRHTPDPAFDAAAESAALGVADTLPAAPRPRWRVGRLIRPRIRVHRVKGTRTPDNRTRAVELSLPAKDMLELARAEGVSPTMYLTGVFFESVRRSAGDLGRARTFVASVPVNLRQFYPSSSARNFFATVLVSHTYGIGADDLGSVCRDLEAQFRPKATPKALEKKLRRLIRVEKSPILRIVPRPVKDVVLGWLNQAHNRHLTVAVSNLGRVTFDEPAESLVERIGFHVSAARPQFCAITHAGTLVVTFTSPFSETDHVAEFARILTGAGIRVRVGAARVTESELAEVIR